jgi:hypothetical protein
MFSLGCAVLHSKRKITATTAKIRQKKLFHTGRFLWQVAEKPSRNPSTMLRARPEFTEGTNGGELISLIFRPC